MEQFCNSDLVKNITKARKNMKVQGNGGTLAVTYKATVTKYKQYVWFIKDTITNIIFLKNLIRQYLVTYDSIDQIFVVHGEDREQPNMEFNMHVSGLRFYNPNDKVVVLRNTVPETSKDFQREKLTVQNKQKLCTPNLGIDKLNISDELFKENKS